MHISKTIGRILLVHAELAINNRSPSSTKVSPFFLSHGFHLEPIEIISEPTQTDNADNPVARGERLVAKLKDAREFSQAAIAVAQQEQERYANGNRAPAHRFRAGDKVWLHLGNIKTNRPSKKFDWIHAKYEIIEPVGSHAYRLNTPSGIHNVFHVSLLQPVSQDPLPSQKTTDIQPSAIIGDDNNEEWYVEKNFRNSFKTNWTRHQKRGLGKMDWIYTTYMGTYSKRR